MLKDILKYVEYIKYYNSQNIHLIGTKTTMPHKITIQIPPEATIHEIARSGTD
jgi:hypothetical protein